MESDNLKKPIYAHQILIGINVVLFIITYMLDPSFSTRTLSLLGAKVNYKIADLEIWRLITAMFLHGGVAHIIFNSVALLSFGKITELIFGKKKFLIIYFISGLFGSIASFISNDAVSVGASGAIFGLLGANMYLYTLNRERYNRVFGKDIDNAAHIGGLIGGFIASWAVGTVAYKTYNIKNKIAQALIPILLVGSLGFGIINYRQSYRYDLFKGYDILMQNDLYGAKNQFEIGLTKNPDAEELKLIIQQIDDVLLEYNSN